ncbi:hypothetical protein PspLS_05577 [Pyricularia sp. CBS 133598]|nr:hypothetical protein PspLS_05577 [Pyricularia sp. CBS 133598]
MKSSIDGWALTDCTPAWGYGTTSKVLGLVCGMAKQGRKGRHLAMGPGTQTGQGQEPQRCKTTYRA